MPSARCHQRVRSRSLSLQSKDVTSEAVVSGKRTTPASSILPILPADVPTLPSDVRGSLRVMGNLDFALTRTPLWLSRFIANLAWVKPYFLGPAFPLASVRTEGHHSFGKLRYFEPLSPAHPPVTLLYLHGGGFVICGLDSHHALCASLANQTGCTVASLDYRLAPENSPPAPQQDVLHAYQYLLSSTAGAGGRVAVGGDSAGGNLAASLCLALALAKKGLPMPPFPCGSVLAPLEELAATPQPAFQVLIYPATDLASDSPSHTRYAEGWMLTSTLREFFWANYLGPPGDSREELKRHILLSPLRAAGAARAALAALCPAVLITAEYDILHDEGVEYGQVLRAAGVQVEEVEGLGLYHGFATSTDLPSGARATAEVARKIVVLMGKGCTR